MARKPEGAHPAEVYSITAAHRSHAEEMRERMTKYAVSMTIRTACFVLLVVVPGPSRWVFAVAAVVLPYIAVIVANAGRERTRTPDTLIGRAEHPGVTAAPAPATAPRADRPAPAPAPRSRPGSGPGPTGAARGAAAAAPPGAAPAAAPTTAEPTVIYVPAPPVTRSA